MSSGIVPIASAYASLARPLGQDSTGPFREPGRHGWKKAKNAEKNTQKHHENRVSK